MFRNFSVAVSVSPHVCFILVLILISVFLGWCIYELGIFHTDQTAECLGGRGGAGSGGWSAAGWLRPPGNFIAGRLRAALLFWFFGGFGCGVPLFVIVLIVFWCEGR